MIYTLSLVLFVSSILASSSHPICKGFRCNNRTYNDKPGWCGRRCRDGPQKPETPVDVPRPPPVALVGSVLTPPSERYEPITPLLCTSVTQAANVVFVRTSQDESGAHAQWRERMEAVASQFAGCGATPNFFDQIKDSKHLFTTLSGFPAGSIAYLQISEHGDAAGRTGLLGNNDEMKGLGDLLRRKLAPKAKIFLDSCNSGKALTGSATLLSNHLNEGHVIVGPSKNLPTNGVLFEVYSALGEELLVELDDNLKLREEVNSMKAYQMLSSLDEHIQQILLMDDNDVSISDLAHNLGPSMYEGNLRFIRENLTPLQLMKYNGKKI